MKRKRFAEILGELVDSIERARERHHRWERVSLDTRDAERIVRYLRRKGHRIAEPTP